MYLTFDQVVLVGDKKPDPTDQVIYEHELGGRRILTPDGGPSRFSPEAKRYGVLYFDASDVPCVIPDRWAWEDAHLAKDFRQPVELEL